MASTKTSSNQSSNSTDTNGTDNNHAKMDPNFNTLQQDGMVSSCQPPPTQAIGESATPIDESAIINQYSGVPPGLEWYLQSHYLPYKNATWSPNDEAGRKLISFPLTPKDMPEIISKYADFFGTWVGPLDFRFKIQGTGLHAGQLGVTVIPPYLDPDDFTTINDYMTQPYQLIEAKCLDFVNYTAVDQRQVFWHPMKYDKKNLDTYAGTLIIFVYSPLGSNATDTRAVNITLQAKLSPKFSFARVIPTHTSTPSISYDFMEDALNCPSRTLLAKAPAFYINKLPALPSYDTQLFSNHNKQGIFNYGVSPMFIPGDPLDTSVSFPWHRSVLNPNFKYNDAIKEGSEDHFIQPRNRRTFSIHEESVQYPFSYANSPFGILASTSDVSFELKNATLSGYTTKDANKVKYKNTKSDLSIKASTANASYRAALDGFSFAAEYEVSPSLTNTLGESLVVFSEKALSGPVGIVGGAKWYYEGLTQAISDAIVSNNFADVDSSLVFALLGEDNIPREYIRVRNDGIITSRGSKNVETYDLKEYKFTFISSLPMSTRLPEPPTNLVNDIGFSTREEFVNPHTFCIDGVDRGIPHFNQYDPDFKSNLAYVDGVVERLDYLMRKASLVPSVIVDRASIYDTLIDMVGGIYDPLRMKFLCGDAASNHRSYRERDHFSLLLAFFAWAHNDPNYNSIISSDTIANTYFIWLTNNRSRPNV